MSHRADLGDMGSAKPVLIRSIKFGLPMLTLFCLLVLPVPAYAHGGTRTASTLAGPLAWGFLAFGAFVIAGISAILLTGGPRRTVADDHRELKGLGGYVRGMRLFSRNARLFIVHVVGMDVIYGTWQVIFNLYLLAVGFDIAFVGLRILVNLVATAATAIPAGLISDRIGRKTSFLLGDGIAAAMALVAISSTDRVVLLATSVISGIFWSLHGVAEPAFMAENSEPSERVHLFSVSGGTRTAAAIIGSALAGLVPLLLLGDMEETAKVGAYRTVAYFGIAGWFASLIPAVMLKQAVLPPTKRSSDLLANMRHPDRIWRLTLPEVLIGLGAGFTLPLMNVFFHQGLDSPEVEIGATFAAGEAFLVVGSFLAPLVVPIWGKVNSVVYTRLLSIPFILLIAYSPELATTAGSVLTAAGLAYVARITLMNMASPVRSAFGMEILDSGERGTQVGLELAASSALSGVATYYGSRMMEAGDFRTPFLLMAASYLVATVLFYRFFAGREGALALAAAEIPADHGH